MSQPALWHQRPAQPQFALDPPEDGHAQDELAEGDDPAYLLHPVVVVNGDRNKANQGCRIEEGDRQKQPFGDHGSESHQAVKQEPRGQGEQAHHPAERRQQMDAEEQGQRPLQEGKHSVSQKQREAHAQQAGENPPYRLGLGSRHRRQQRGKSLAA